MNTSAAKNILPALFLSAAMVGTCTPTPSFAVSPITCSEGILTRDSHALSEADIQKITKGLKRKASAIRKKIKALKDEGKVSKKLKKNLKHIQTQLKDIKQLTKDCESEGKENPGNEHIHTGALRKIKFNGFTLTLFEKESANDGDTIIDASFVDNRGRVVTQHRNAASKSAPAVPGIHSYLWDDETFTPLCNGGYCSREASAIPEGMTSDGKVLLSFSHTDSETLMPTDSKYVVWDRGAFHLVQDVPLLDGEFLPNLSLAKDGLLIGDELVDEKVPTWDSSSGERAEDIDIVPLLSAAIAPYEGMDFEGGCTPTGDRQVSASGIQIADDGSIFGSVQDSYTCDFGFGDPADIELDAEFVIRSNGVEIIEETILGLAPAQPDFIFDKFYSAASNGVLAKVGLVADPGNFAERAVGLIVYPNHHETVSLTTDESSAFKHRIVAAVNAAGTVVGTTTLDPASLVLTDQSEAFMVKDGNAITLNSLLPADAGLKITQAHDINDCGQIAGSASFIGDNDHIIGVLLSPDECLNR